MENARREEFAASVFFSADRLELFAKARVLLLEPQDFLLELANLSDRFDFASRITLPSSQNYLRGTVC